MVSDEGSVKYIITIIGSSWSNHILKEIEMNNGLTIFMGRLCAFCATKGAEKVGQYYTYIIPIL